MRAGLLPDAGRGVCVVKEEVDDGQVDGHTQSLSSALLDNKKIEIRNNNNYYNYKHP